MLTTYDFIAQNKRRTWLLVLLFPLTFVLLSYVVILGVYCFVEAPSQAEVPIKSFLLLANQQMAPYLMVAIPALWLGALVWMAISYFSGDEMLLRGAGAVQIHKYDQPEIYRLVENLCLTAGLPVPRIYIIDDNSLNAFATGRDPRYASIALTKGIVQRLERAELEGVIAHELSHIQNRDIRLMLITVAGISFFTFLSELCVRAALRQSSSRSSKNDTSVRLLLLVIGMALALYGYIITPLIRFAMSRTREYQADASAALLTRNPGALARALEKIAADPRVEVLDAHASMAAMCIANPLAKANLFAGLAGLYATHPPIQLRIAKLRVMDGKQELDN